VIKSHDHHSEEWNNSSSVSDSEVVLADLQNSNNKESYCPSDPLVPLDLDLEGLEDASRLRRSSLSTDTSMSSPARCSTTPSESESDTYSDSDFDYTREVDTDEYSTGTANLVCSMKKTLTKLTFVYQFLLCHSFTCSHPKALEHPEVVSPEGFKEILLYWHSVIK